MVVKAVRLQSVHDLLRVTSPAQNARWAGVTSFSEHYESSSARGHTSSSPGRPASLIKFY